MTRFGNFLVGLALALLLLPSVARAADSVGKTAVRSVAVNDLQAQLTGADGSSLAQVAASNGAAAGNGLFVLGGRYDSSLPTNTNGRSVGLQTDVNGRLLVTQDASAAALITNLTKVGGATISLGQTTMSASLPVAFASDSSNLPSNLKQVNGSSISLGSAASSASLPVVVASDQGAISTKPGAPTGAATNRAAPVNIASAATTAIVCKGSLSVSQPFKLYSVTITGAALARCTLRFNDNASMTNFADVETSPASPTVTYRCPDGFCALTTSGTVTTLQVEASCNNFDSAAQDFGCSVSYCQAASGC